MRFLPARMSPKVAVLAALAVAAGSSGCSANASGALGPRALRPEVTTITVCDFLSIDSAGLYIANLPQYGYFKEMGLTVKIIPQFAGVQTIQGIQSGKCDISAGDYVTYVTEAASNHLPLQIIAESSTLQNGVIGLMVTPHSRIRSVSNLVGKTVAITQPVDIATLLLDTLFAENGLKTGNAPGDVHFVAGFQLPTAAKSLMAGRVNVSPMPDPFLTEAEEQYGLTNITDINQGANKNFPILGYAVLKSWAQEHPSALHDFLTALKEGQNEADLSRGAVEAGITSIPALGISEQNASLVSLPGFPTSIDPVLLQRVPDGMLRFGMIKKPFNIASIIYHDPDA